MGNPPKRNHHEGKPEQGAGFRGGYVPSSPAHPKYRVGNRDREPLIRTDMTEAVRLTGQWRDKQERYHLFINHAGPHIELLITLVEGGNVGKTEDIPRDRARTETRAFRMGGDVDASDRTSYHLYAQHPSRAIDDKSQGCGRLRHVKGGQELELTLELDGFEDTAAVAKLKAIASSGVERIGDAPNLFENHLGGREVPVEVRTALWFPPTPTQASKLGSFLFDARIELDGESYRQDQIASPQTFEYVELVERYFAIQDDTDGFGKLDRQQRQWMANIASALDALVKVARSEAQQCPAADGGMDVFGLDDWRLLTLGALAERELTLEPGQTHTLLTHTQAILDGAPTGASLREFERLLHLQPDTGGHEYEAEIEFVDVQGVAEDVGSSKKLKKVLRRALKKSGRVAKKLSKHLPWGTLAGVMVVKKLDDGPFEASYVLVLAGYKRGKSAGSSATAVRSSGKAERVYGQAWRPEHIPGRAHLVELGASVFGGGRGKGFSGTLMRCEGGGAGRPPSPSLNFNFTGLSDVIGPKFGAGIGFSRLVGEILPVTADGGDVVLDVPEAVPFEYGAHSSAGPLHFPINGAGLTPGACELLEIFAACELAVLSRPGVVVRVDGYADQPDDALNNEILSRNRAISVFNYLKNILEDDFPVPELEETLPEDEERKEAERAKDEKYVIFDPSPTGGQVRIVWHGEGKSNDEQSDSRNTKPRYDVERRRVDLKVDGKLRLTLSRAIDK